MFPTPCGSCLPIVSFAWMACDSARSLAGGNQHFAGDETPPNWRNRAHAISVIYAVKNLMTHLDATGTLLSARGLMAMAVFDGLR